MTLNERLDDFADVVPAIIWMTDGDGRCTYVNRPWSEFTGLPVTPGADWRDALHPDDARRIVPLVAEALRARRSFSIEYRARRADGAYRWMLDRGVPRLDGDGAFAGHIGTVVDISERKVSEEALKWSESRFRSLAESVPHIIWAVLPDGSLQFLNDRVTTITGEPPAPRRIIRWLSVLHPADVEHTVRAWRHAIRTESVFEVEHRLEHHTGRHCWYLTRAVPHRDESGAIRLWYGTSTDIHRQKEVENALRDSRERLDAALEASLTGTFRWDIKRDILDWDENLYRVFGRMPDGTVGVVRDVVDLVHPDDRASVVAGIDRIAREGLDYIHEFRVVWPSGSVHWVSHRSAVYRDRNGSPEYMIGACTDITTRKTAEIALQEAKNESERSNAAKDQFLAILSHELRTPLNPVKMVLDMLAADENLERDTRTLLDTARRNVDVQARLIDDLLDITRISTGKLRLEPIELGLHEIIENVVEICCGEIEKKRLSVAIVRGAASDRLLADPARLTQVFWNLVRNAAKFTPNDGTITITTSSAAGAIRTEVTDTGIGMDPARLAKVFDLFVQEQPGRREGLGLGLAISRSIVELHGGRIEARSEGLGHGTTIVVELPAVVASDAPAPVAEPLHILVVEHDVQLREAIAMWLEARGYRVSQAATAAEAQAVDGARVLISDLKLPGGSDGVDLLRALRRRQSIHAIAMSGSGNAADVERAIRAGYVSYLVKPLDLDRLLAEIEAFARQDAARG